MQSSRIREVLPRWESFLTRFPSVPAPGLLTVERDPDETASLVRASVGGLLALHYSYRDHHPQKSDNCLIHRKTVKPNTSIKLQMYIIATQVSPEQYAWNKDAARNMIISHLFLESFTLLVSELVPWKDKYVLAQNVYNNGTFYYVQLFSSVNHIDTIRDANHSLNLSFCLSVAHCSFGFCFSTTSHKFFRHILTAGGWNILQDFPKFILVARLVAIPGTQHVASNGFFWFLVSKSQQKGGLYHRDLLHRLGKPFTTFQVNVEL